MKNLAAIVSLTMLGCTSPKNAEDINQEPENQTEIFYGEEVQHSETPSTVAIFVGSGLCSGTMIHKQMVLTAAHCYREPFFLKVVYGVSDVNLVVEENNGEDVYEVENAIKHPDYGKKGIGSLDDLMLIILKEPIEGAEIAKIKQPPFYEPELQLEQTEFVYGYGRDENEESRVLKRAELPITYLTDLELIAGKNFEVAPSPGVCFGDSGGAMLQYYQGEDYLSGVPSRLAPLTPAECGFGAIHVRPECYQPWIRDVCENNLDPETCTNFAEEVECDFNDHIKINTEVKGPGCTYAGEPMNDDGLIPFLAVPLFYFLRRKEE